MTHWSSSARPQAAPTSLLNSTAPYLNFAWLLSVLSLTMHAFTPTFPSFPTPRRMRTSLKTIPRVCTTSFPRPPTVAPIRRSTPSHCGALFPPPHKFFTRICFHSASSPCFPHSHMTALLALPQRSFPRNPFRHFPHFSLSSFPAFLPSPADWRRMVSFSKSRGGRPSLRRLTDHNSGHLLYGQATNPYTRHLLAETLASGHKTFLRLLLPSTSLSRRAPVSPLGLGHSRPSSFS